MILRDVGHVSRIHVVDRVGALTSIERRIQVLFVRVFAVHLLRAGHRIASCRIIQATPDH